MQEVRNATRFADPESVRGLSGAGAFRLAALLGGKRKRTVTAVKLRYTKLTAVKVLVQGKEVLDPALFIAYKEKKFTDPRGDRLARDCPHYETYWIYPVFRQGLAGCFLLPDSCRAT